MRGESRKYFRISLWQIKIEQKIVAQELQIISVLNYFQKKFVFEFPKSQICFKNSNFVRMFPKFGPIYGMTANFGRKPKITKTQNFNTKEYIPIKYSCILTHKFFFPLKLVKMKNLQSEFSPILRVKIYLSKCMNIWLGFFLLY